MDSGGSTSQYFSSVPSLVSFQIFIRCSYKFMGAYVIVLLLLG